MGATQWQIFADDLRFLHSPPVCLVERSTSQTLGTGTDAGIVFDVELVDNDGMHAPNGSAITLTRSDRYYCVGALAFANVPIGSRRVYILRSSIDIITSENIDSSTAVFGAELNPHTVERFTASQYIQLVARQNSGSNLDVLPDAQLSVAWVGD